VVIKVKALKFSACEFVAKNLSLAEEHKQWKSKSHGCYPRGKEVKPNSFHLEALSLHQHEGDYRSPNNQ